jgi:translation initiation factor 2D
LTAFLKSIEKEGLVTLKQAKGGDVQLVSVTKSHPAYSDHQYALCFSLDILLSLFRGFRTVQQEAERQKKAEAREVAEAGAAASRAREITVTEFWKPHQASIRLFEEMGKE